MAEERTVAPIGVRVRAALLVFGGVWPLITLLNAAASFHMLPYYSTNWYQSTAAAGAGVLLSAGEFLTTGALAVSLSVLLFAMADRHGWIRRPLSPGVLGYLRESLVILVVLFWGTTLWYPAAIFQPGLGLLLLLPMWTLTVLVGGAVVILTSRLAARGKARQLTAVVMLGGVLAPLPSILRPLAPAAGRTAELVLLGLDSLSYDETRGWFQDWIVEHSGTSYEKAVTPAILTNAVWSSVLAVQYPSEHGVSQTFQSLETSQAQLLSLARQAGYWTVSRFPDQLTSAVGSEAGFDEDLSGPIGWRQLILPIVHNSSVLVPLVRPLLPRIRWFASPPNLAGSFSFSLRREIDELLHAGRPNRQTFVAGHLTYLHFTSYPRYVDLGWAECRKILTAPSLLIRDRTFDWIDTDRETDVVRVHQWKRHQLLTTVARELERSNIGANDGRVVLFSDHGERFGLSAQTVTDPKYHRVLLATFNLPVREPSAPRSLIDIGYLLGLAEAIPGRPHVEFALFPSDLWRALVQSARLDWSGAVHLDPATVAKAHLEPLVFEPWTDPGAARDLTEPASPAGGSASGRRR